MLDRLEALEEEFPLETMCRESDAYRQRVHKSFEIRPESLLKLVSNLDTLKAFAILLEDNIRQAWRDLSGFDFEVLQPATEKDRIFAKQIQGRARRYYQAANRQVADLEDSASRAESGSLKSDSSICVPTTSDGPSREQHDFAPDTRGPKPMARDPRYEAIDDQLRKIADTHPKGHAEVFDFLEKRVPIPSAEPFKSARGWLNGFRKDPEGARAWLSKAWSRLKLPPFPRGPK